MELYVINHCNEWHEYSSFRLIGVVERDELDGAILQIKKECEYNEDEFNTFIDIQEIELNELDI